MDPLPSAMVHQNDGRAEDKESSGNCSLLFVGGPIIRLLCNILHLHVGCDLPVERQEDPE